MGKDNSAVLRLDLLVEVAPGAGCAGHVPELPGLCFRADDPLNLQRMARSRVVTYARWLLEENLATITLKAAAVTERVRLGREGYIQVVEAERRDGSPLWISGNPAVLFESDRRALDDEAVRAHLSFTGQVVRQMGVLVGALSSTQRAKKPADKHRSVDETLTHVGNCIWWYCSRIDDLLPEPGDQPAEEPRDRMERLLGAARESLLGVPYEARKAVYIPTRFPTTDPKEPWTHTKVCRRQAEHVWEHLPGLKRVVRVAKRS